MTSNTILTPTKHINLISFDTSSGEKARVNMIKQFNAYLVEDKENIKPQSLNKSQIPAKDQFEVHHTPCYEIERPSLCSSSQKRQPFTFIPVKMLR